MRFRKSLKKLSRAENNFLEYDYKKRQIEWFESKLHMINRYRIPEPDDSFMYLENFERFQAHGEEGTISLSNDIEPMSDKEADFFEENLEKQKILKEILFTHFGISEILGA